MAWSIIVEPSSSAFELGAGRSDLTTTTRVLVTAAAAAASSSVREAIVRQLLPAETSARARLAARNCH